MGLFLSLGGINLAALKPALTCPEQIARLKEVHGLVIEDNERAIEILSRINYYRLSGYGIGLRQKTNAELYQEGVSLESLYRLYEFDSAFKNSLVHVIEQLEIQLRAQISNYLAVNYGPECYMDSNFFKEIITKDGKTVHNRVVKSFKTECKRQENTPFVIHHNKNYDGHFPLWVAIELFTFGNLSSLFSIMTPTDQKAIADMYNTDPKYLGSWILSLVEIRNICAHYGRLYNMPLKQSPYLYPEYRKYRKSKIIKVFFAIVTIKRMLNGDERWQAFEKQLEALFDEYADVIRLSYIGFPKDWKYVLQHK